MAGEKYKSSYTNERGEKIPVTAKIEYKVPGFFGLRNAKSGETPTDTIYTIYAQIPLRVRRSADGVVTERMDNSTGEWIPLMYNTYWDNKSLEVEKNKLKTLPIWKQALNFIGFNQEGGTIQSLNSEIKSQIKQLIKLRKDPQKGQHAMQLLGEFMQKNPNEFKTIILELALEDLDVAKFVQELQQASQQSSTPMAAKGAKLNYVKELKGICPEGYMKAGGRCKPCEAKMKEKGGDPVKSFKVGRKCKK